MDFKLYIQTVYIPRENILFIDEWLNHHSKLGVDEFWLYDNLGSRYKDFVGNLEINGQDRHGNPVLEKTKHLSNGDISKMEDEIFKKYNVKKITWSPKNNSNEITYNQMGAVYDFVEKVKNGFCCFIDIDEFIFINKENNLKEYIINNYSPEKEGITILQKRFATRWECPNNVLSINKTFEINTFYWGPKIIANISKVKKIKGVTIHSFIINNDVDDNNCYFKHFNHNQNVHNWLLKNYKSIDKNWVPKNFNELWS